MHNDFEPARACRLLRPKVRALRTAGDDYRFEREFGNGGLDRLAIGAASAPDNSNSHATVPAIHTNADAAPRGCGG